MHAAPRQRCPVPKEVRIRQVRHESRVVLADFGRKQKRPAALQVQREARQEARAGVVEAQLVRATGRDVTGTIQDDEGFVGLEDSTADVDP